MSPVKIFLITKPLVITNNKKHLENMGCSPYSLKLNLAFPYVIFWTEITMIPCDNSDALSTITFTRLGIGGGVFTSA